MAHIKKHALHILKSERLTFVGLLVGNLEGLLLLLGSLVGTSVGLIVGTTGLLVGDFVGLSVVAVAVVVVAQNGTSHSSQRSPESVV